MRHGSALRPAERQGLSGAPASLLRLHRHSLMNVLLIGGDVSRRLALAKEFHRESPLRHGPLIRVDCVDDEAMLLRALRIWTGLGDAGPGADPFWAAARGTLYLDDVTRLSGESQKLLLALQRSAARDHEEAPCYGRLIVGCAGDPEAVAVHGEFSADLLDCLDKVRVEVGRGSARGAA